MNEIIVARIGFIDIGMTGGELKPWHAGMNQWLGTGATPWGAIIDLAAKMRGVQ